MQYETFEATTFIAIMPICSDSLHDTPIYVFLTCVQLHNHNMNMQIHAHVRRTRRRSRGRRSSTHFDGKEQQTEDASSGCFVCFVCLGSMSIIRATGPGETPGDTCHCNYLQLHPLIAQPPNQRPSLPDLARVSFTLCYPQVQQLTEQPAIDYGFIASSPHRQPRHLGCVFGVVQVQTHPFPPFLTQLLTSHANLTHAQVQKYKKNKKKGQNKSVSWTCQLLSFRALST